MFRSFRMIFELRASFHEELCTVCKANGRLVRLLTTKWNKNDPVANYRIISSNAALANPQEVPF